MIDSHAHLYWDSFRLDLDAVLDRAAQAGVNTIINIGTNLETSKIAAGQKSDKVKIYSTIGIHPHDWEKYITNSAVSIHKDINRLEEIYQSNKDTVVAVGECGLDYYFQHNPGYQPSTLPLSQVKQIQRQLFRAQIDLAKDLKLPVVVHCRDAWDEILNYLPGTKGVLHCFSGTLEDAQKAVKLGYSISFAGNITYPKSDKLKAVAKDINLDRILIETDAPFLAPQSRRGTRNEPAYVAEVAQTIAQIKGVNLEEVAKYTTNNTKKLFNKYNGNLTNIL